MADAVATRREPLHMDRAGGLRKEKNPELLAEIGVEKTTVSKEHPGVVMPKYLTIGYGDRAGYDRISRAVREVAHKHDAFLVNQGAIVGIAGVPVSVRNPDSARVETTKGPYMSSSLPLAGFGLIEAKDLAEAIEMVSHTPCAVAHGVVEVWPLE